MSEERWLLCLLLTLCGATMALSACGLLDPRQPVYEAPAGAQGASLQQVREALIRESCKGKGTPLRYLACRTRWQREHP